MLDLVQLLPHSKKDVKLDTKVRHLLHRGPSGAHTLSPRTSAR
jgi:hypothetical protein